MMQGSELSRRFLSFVIGLLAASTVLSAAEAVAPAKQPKDNAKQVAKAPKAPVAEHEADASVTPVPRKDGWWQERHTAMNERVKKGNVDLLFIGDSITQGWEGAGKQAWAKHYEKRNAVNLGIGGDRTQHVLWRLEHGNIDSIKPKLAVIMIGTNNSSVDTVAEIADGVRQIVKKLRASLPETKILLLGIFPRGENPNETRGKLLQINQIIAKLGDGKNVRYMDFGSRFVSNDGSLPKQIMPDFLHLSEKGYQIWANAIEAQVKTMMGEK